MLNKGSGIKAKNAFVYYRQHEDSLVGFDFTLTHSKLHLGMEVKESHYRSFRSYKEFDLLHREILELKETIRTIGENRYIEIINNNFEIEKFCWWENIKLKKEIEKWI